MPELANCSDLSSVPICHRDQYSSQIILKLKMKLTSSWQLKSKEVLSSILFFLDLSVCMLKSSCLSARYHTCKLELRNLVHKKRDLYSADILSKDLLENIAWESRPPPSNWKPKGILVAHLQEHRGAINRYVILFAFLLLIQILYMY